VIHLSPQADVNLNKKLILEELTPSFIPSFLEIKESAGA
jgi:hypothetical protein